MMLNKTQCSRKEDKVRERVGDDKLNSVNGGYVVAHNGQYYVVADKNGNILSKGPVQSTAELSAKYQGQSIQLISAEEYENIFGKSLPG